MVASLRDRMHAAVLSLCASFALTAVAQAQAPKELKARSGESVALVNLLAAKPDCSSTPGPVSLPILKEKPANGAVRLLVTVANVPASGNCQARKVPTIAIVYTANKGFEGPDTVGIEIEMGNRTTTLHYRINVGPKAQPL